LPGFISSATNICAIGTGCGEISGFAAPRRISKQTSAHYCAKLPKQATKALKSGSVLTITAGVNEPGECREVVT
jgi:methionine aminopeptidase